MRIKEQYLDMEVKCPLTSQHVMLRFVDERLYNYYSTHGYSTLFEEIEEIIPVEEEIIEETEIKTETTNDLPESGE